MKLIPNDNVKKEYKYKHVNLWVINSDAASFR